ncbi:hypothetical protein HRR78_000200 [Exophiala dermatitidis]|nr:hypothetical protein HRR75_001107 [Exophiala dermatitidis]KAJ4559680.1 hypothetical protein HRR78_000200 [Exophiala dermatitidis]
MLSVTNPDIDLIDRPETPAHPASVTTTPEGQQQEPQQQWPGGSGSGLDFSFDPVPESLQQTAVRLTWLASWKLQQEYELIEPDLPKVIGHIAVWTSASHCVDSSSTTDDGQVDGVVTAIDSEELGPQQQQQQQQQQDVLPSTEDPFVLDGTESQSDSDSEDSDSISEHNDALFSTEANSGSNNPEGLPLFPPEEEDAALAMLENPADLQQHQTPNSVSVKEVNLQDSLDPFSDDEEEGNYSSSGYEKDNDSEDDMTKNPNDTWSSDGETYCSSDYDDNDDDEEEEEKETRKGELEQDIADCRCYSSSANDSNKWPGNNDTFVVVDDLTKRKEENEMWERYTNLGPIPPRQTIGI